MGLINFITIACILNTIDPKSTWIYVIAKVGVWLVAFVIDVLMALDKVNK